MSIYPLRLDFLLLSIVLGIVLPAPAAAGLRLDGMLPPGGDRGYSTPVTVGGEGFLPGAEGALYASSPHLLGQTEFRRVNARRIVLDGSRAYAVGGAPYLYVVEISDPAHPGLVRAIPAAPSTPALRDVVSDGRYAYATIGQHGGDPGGLQVFDLLQPDAAGPVAVLQLNSPVGLTRAGSYLYVVVADRDDDDMSLRVVDVRDPLHPRAAGRARLSGAAGAGYAATADGYAYALVDGHLYVVDVGDPAAPVAVATLMLGGTAYDIAVAGGYAYAASASGLWVVDVSVATRPRIVANLGQDPTESPRPGELVYPVPRSVALDGERAYVGYTGMVRIVDLAAPSRPVVLYQAPAPDTATGIAVDGGLAYLAAGDVQVLDVSVAANAAMLGQTGFDDQVYDLDVAGGFAYIGGRKGLHVAEVSDVRRPRPLEIPYPGSTNAVRVVVADGYAYVGSDEPPIPGKPFRGIQVFDLSRPEAPRPVGRVSTGSTVFGIQDGYAYVAYGEGRGNNLRVIDLRNPHEPVQVGLLGGIGGETATPVEQVAVAGDYAYLASKDSLHVVNVASPSASRLVGGLGYPALEPMSGLEVRGGYAYLLGGRDLLVVDIGNPVAPRLIASLRLPATAPNRQALALDIAGDHAYVVVSGMGVVVVHIGNPALPRQLGVLAYVAGSVNGLTGGLRVVEGRVFGTTRAPGLAILRGFSPSLRSVWDSESVLAAEVAAWLPTGGYDLAVANPGSAAVQLPHAFEVTGAEGLDTDGDGLDDPIEASYPFLDPRNPADAGADQDGDGLSNLEEIVFAWDPADPAVPRRADLSLRVDPPPQGVPSGADFALRYTIANAGPDTADDGLFGLDLDPSLELVAVESEGGLCDAGEGVVYCRWALLGVAETISVGVALRAGGVGDARLRAYAGAGPVDVNQADNRVESAIPVQPDSPYAPALGQRPRATTAADGRVYTVFRNGQGGVVLLHDSNGHEDWGAQVLPVPFAAVAGDTPPDLWIDPKDGLLKVALAGADGLLLYSREADGGWRRQDLTALVGGDATPVVNGLTHYITPDLARDYDGNPILDADGAPIYPIPEAERNNVHIAGFDANGELVLYRQVRGQDGGPVVWDYLNLTREQLIPGLQNPAAWRSGPVGYATPWNGWNLAGVVGDGNLRVVWTAPDRGGVWSTTDISRGAPDGVASAYVNWGLNLVTTGLEGAPQISWWSAEHAQQGVYWAVTSFARDLHAPPFRPAALTGFTSPVEAANYVAGITREGEFVLYHWTPETEWVVEYPAAGIPAAEVPVDALVGLAGKDGVLSILGIAAGGDLLRYLQAADGSWRVQNATRQAALRAPGASP